MNVTAVAPDSSDYQSRGSAEIAPMGKHAKRRSLRPALEVDNAAKKTLPEHGRDLGHPSGSTQNRPCAAITSRSARYVEAVPSSSTRIIEQISLVASSSVTIRSIGGPP
jgi:hypothetical protein